MNGWTADEWAGWLLLAGCLFTLLAVCVGIIIHDTYEGVGTGAGEGATGQDTGTAWVTRSEDYPGAPAQAHSLMSSADLDADVSGFGQPCDICGEPADTADGIVGMYLCPRATCLERAWDIAFGAQAPTDTPGGAS